MISSIEGFDMSLNARKGQHGYSLRRSLENQGVTTEEGMQAHFDFVLTTESQAGRKIDITRYRINPNNPNMAVPLMG
jgi:hypothetical protein